MELFYVPVLLLCSNVSLKISSFHFIVIKKNPKAIAKSTSGKSKLTYKGDLDDCFNIRIMLDFWFFTSIIKATALVDDEVTLTQFMPLVPFYAPWKNQKVSVFLMLLGGIAKHQWHEMGQEAHVLPVPLSKQ